MRFVLQEQRYFFIYEGHDLLMRTIFVYKKLSFLLWDKSWKLLKEYKFWPISDLRLILYFFRVAIFIVIGNILNQIQTLIKKITSDPSYLGLKTLKSIICCSGFPKKLCQGCRISEGAGTILLKITFLKCWNVWDSCHASAVSGNSM